MPAIDSIIQVNITPTTTAVATQSFSIPLILGPTKAQSAGLTLITCSSPADLLTQGYTTNSVEYAYAQALCSQALRPDVFKVCLRSPSDTIATEIQEASAIDDSWYTLITPQATDGDIYTAAQQVESMTKLYVACSSSAAIASSSSGDVGSELQQAKFTRTALLYSGLSAANGIEAAWVGGQAPKAPGSATWAYKTLVGFPADSISPSGAAAMIGVPVLGQVGKAVNCYQLVGGVPITQEGTVANGGYIDLRIGIDSLRSLIKTNIYQALVSNDKIPYTDAGAVIIEGAIRAAINTHVDYGFIAADSTTTPITVSYTPISQVPATQRAQRIGPPFTFSCQASGAQQAVTVSGTVNI